MSVEASIQTMSPLEGYTAAVQIHEGAETVVYRAREAATGAPVILKVTKNEFPTPRELARLRREYSILRDLDLPQTPRAVALLEHGHGLALVMADLGHATLRELLEYGSLPIEATLTIAISLSDVLSAVHRGRIIHKDVTPTNILVDEATQTAHLIDFGISARLVQEMQSPGGLNALEGTLLYIAPEQTGRMNRAVDLRADLYSLGVVLYEMLTGVVPFQAATPTELIYSHLARQATPPYERAADVPEPLSDIVMTLLAKTPEERYQSDAGLRADLAECLRQWQATKSIAPFPLRRHDRATELRRTPKLYGRERDIEALLQAFQRVCVRGPELCLVSGYSGVGKSALVYEIRKLTAHHGGYFVSGKFDQISRGAPLAPVVHAFRELILQILTEPTESLVKWKAKLRQALGENGRLVSDLIPELSLIVGEQPEVPALSPDQAKNRFELTLQNFLDVFAKLERPLVIFLDDLQWIDSASLNFLRLLLVDAYSKNVLLIGAYRNNEVALGHPLQSMLDELGRAGLRPTDIQLQPLDREMVLHLVADTLTSRPEEVSDLARLVFDKTQGNPFFAHQFLITLNEQKLLRFDAAAGVWRWDIDQIRRANVTANVVDLMLGKLQRLSPATRQALMLASCIGFQFDLHALSTIGETSIVETAGALWGAMREGLVVPLDGDYRLLEGASEGADVAEITDDFNVRYRFLHDRILHAAYTLVEPAHKQQLHLSIGRLLRRRHGDALREEDLLEIVRHLNLGARQITDHEEGLDLARLDLRAARKAKAATAYSAAADYCRAGIDLLDAADWESDYDLCFALHVEDAQCEYLDGNADRAKALFDTVLPRTRTDVERASICKMRVNILCSITQYAEALAVGCEGLGILGLPVTMADLGSEAVFMSEVAELQTSLGDRRIGDLIDTPELQDPRLRGALEIFDAMAASAFYTGPIYYGVVGFKGLNLALKHGHTDVCAFNYINGAYVLTLHMGRVVEGLAFGRLALDLLAKFPNARQVPKVNMCFGCCYPLAGSLREAEQYFHVAVETGLGMGDFAFLGAACLLGTILKISAGDQLEDVLENGNKHLAIVRRTKELVPIASMTFTRQTVAALLGRTRNRTSLGDDGFDEEAFVGRLNDREHGFALFHYYFLKLQLHCLHGEHAEALAALDEAEKRAPYAGGNPAAKLHAFYACMAILGAPAAATPEESARRAALLERNRTQLDFQAVSSPKGFQHMAVLVDAEAARVAGEIPRTIALYEQAIQLSHEIKAPNIEALACELGGKFYMSLGAMKAAGAFMRDAYRAYLHWGALPKAEAIEAEYGHLLPSLRNESTRKKTTTKSGDLSVTGSTLLGQTTLGSLRDASLVLRAAQAIAGEVDLPRVIERLSALVLENAGAQRGALLLSRDGELVVSALFGDTSSAVAEGHGKPLDDADDLARSVVLYVARTQESVVLDDTSAMTRFSEDPYIRGGAPNSLLCLPLLHQARLSGVLYLENRATSGVFNAARVELLALLSSQAAIAIENARLISSVRAATDEVTLANERLELTVAHRTEELGLANKDLSAAKQRLEHELARREKIEQERTTLQEQVIAAQRARLEEMSTPLIPITDEVVVMPLIGTLDRERASQVMTAALEGAQRYRARVVILDITGIQQIDSNVAEMLIGISGALRLLGTEALLTGIAPTIAQTLVSLGLDLSSFVTKGTLQSGMDYALKLVRSAHEQSAPRNGNGRPSPRAR